ncbi:cilia- and flagella-associated protein 52 [Selaginella moellendorffii]|uniref:cilia- and flagella-associated protein 52 n=1 Tax=Selaginella moellendorffii TaxID=88036 RepID=UPI000D1C4E9E|nr:cilia- and flagella-associated protein 52 [Selaginella moellendorffii]|eukprot:XP_024535234.1 cilia- and flagella-associated protein 52 [Selaginella moellendorffii]
MSRPLPLGSVIGYSGTVPGGMVLHPDKSTLVYALGTCIVLRHRGDDHNQEFLQGHSNKVSCLAISRSGKYLATGQVSYMGFTTTIIIWDLEERRILHQLNLHKVKVESLSFSPCETFVASTGGQDDGKLVVWYVKSGKAVCGSPTPIDYAQCVCFFNCTSTKLVTAASAKLTIWEFDEGNRQLRPYDCQLGKIRRVLQTIVIDSKDEYVYVGTQTGDVLQVSLGPKLFQNHGPKQKLCMGVQSTISTPFDDLLVGGGDGNIVLLRSGTLKTVSSTKVHGSVTAMANGNADQSGSFEFFVGTSKSNMYLVKYDAKRNMMASQLIHTCHYDKINDIAFPSGYSEVFATCSMDDIRIWQLEKCRELLRIQVPNQKCMSLAFMPDGKSLISGWNDGRIRAFGPQTGKLLYTILNAHKLGVTAITGTSDSGKIISGGVDGQVRVWRIGPQSHSLIATMKEHVEVVNGVQVRKNDSECVSCSSDGSCIVWDLTRFTRNNSMFASTFFKAIQYHPDESQLLTTGTDRKITYWDAYDCAAIRIVDGSLTSEMTALDISPDGTAFVSGGYDKEVLLWNYDEGHPYFTGKGHSEPITKVKISPDQQHVVSVGEEGGIFIWDYKAPTSASTSPASVGSPASGSPEL